MVINYVNKSSSKVLMEQWHIGFEAYIERGSPLSHKTRNRDNLLPSRLYCRYRNLNGHTPIGVCGLYRRSGISPCLED